MTLRETQGSPIWLPPGVKDPHLVKRERKAYDANEEARALIETGLFETGSAFVYRCPICGRQERNDQRMEPMCDGPSWLSEHPPEIMQRVA